MTKDQLTWIRKEYPEEYERVMYSLVCEWSIDGLVHELLKWMPKVEFMNMVHNVENWDELETVRMALYLEQVNQEEDEYDD